ncbi:hypothetical protein PCL_00123 [Purpureocillium lilacinum]|uniref:Uncharacterized protein n=1 Tax=Purpureocillium lilacinum TaxID=33203 RepID=A0A2U3E681_PURLI|nr:hypothetical protein PCL_00123 [Purpureocillium lilacinum]
MLLARVRVPISRRAPHKQPDEGGGGGGLPPPSQRNPCPPLSRQFGHKLCTDTAKSTPPGTPPLFAARPAPAPIICGPSLSLCRWLARSLLSNVPPPPTGNALGWGWGLARRGGGFILLAEAKNSRAPSTHHRGGSNPYMGPSLARLPGAMYGIPSRVLRPGSRVAVSLHARPPARPPRRLARSLAHPQSPSPSPTQTQRQARAARKKTAHGRAVHWRDHGWDGMEEGMEGCR